MYSGSGAKIAGVVGQVGLSAASKIMCYLLVMFLECWQAKVRHELGLVECASRSQFGRNFANVQHKMSALSALPPPPPPLNYYTKKIPCARLRRPSLPTGDQRVQRGLAQPNACTTDIIPHSCTGMRQRPGRFVRVHPIFLGKRCLNQDFRDLWIDRMPGDGSIPIRWVSSHRLKRHTAVAK